MDSFYLSDKGRVYLCIYLTDVSPHIVDVKYNDECCLINKQ